MKSDAFYIEKAVGPIFGVFLFVLDWNLNLFLDCEQAKDIVSKTADISFIVFGFLLTVLTLIIQGNEDLKTRTLYERLIKYNRKVVVLSLVLGFYSMILFSFFSDSDAQFPQRSIYSSLFFFCVGWLLYETGYYIFLFYKLAIDQKL